VRLGNSVTVRLGNCAIRKLREMSMDCNIVDLGVLLSLRFVFFSGAFAD
jgi:hypothetical protein